MEQFIWQNKSWPQFFWNPQTIIYTLANFYKSQGLLEGYLRAMDLTTRKEVTLNCFTSEILNSCKFENIEINETQLRSVIAKRIDYNIKQLEDVKLTYQEAQKIETVVNIFFEILENCNNRLTLQHILHWNNQLCKIDDYAGKKKTTHNNMGFRTEEYSFIEDGQICYTAPSPKKISMEMDSFLQWINKNNCFLEIDNVLKSAIAHFYFIAIHPFENNNNILAGMLAYGTLFHQKYIDNQEKSPYPIYMNNLYSVANEIFEDRKDYNYMFKQASTGTLDMTFLISWYIRKSNNAVNNVIKKLNNMENNNLFMKKAKDLSINKRQEKFLSFMLSDIDNKITSTEYARICECSQDTACRDLEKLVNFNLIAKSNSGGRSTYYSLIV